MKKNILKPTIIVLGILLLVIAISICFYTRSWTIKDKYPTVDLSHCTEISGFYFKGNQKDDISFTIDKNNKHFNEIINSFKTTKFKTKLSNLFSTNTKKSQYDESDYLWHIIFHIKDGNKNSFLHFENYFGNLEVSLNGEQIKCSTDNQKIWSDKLMNIITIN